MMSVPAEYVPYLVGAAIAVAVIFPAILLFGDWKEARTKRKAERQQQGFQVPQAVPDETTWPPAPKA